MKRSRSFFRFRTKHFTAVDSTVWSGLSGGELGVDLILDLSIHTCLETAHDDVISFEHWHPTKKRNPIQSLQTGAVKRTTKRNRTESDCEKYQKLFDVDECHFVSSPRFFGTSFTCQSCVFERWQMYLALLPVAQIL